MGPAVDGEYDRIGKRTTTEIETETTVKGYGGAGVMELLLNFNRPLDGVRHTWNAFLAAPICHLFDGWD